MKKLLTIHTKKDLCFLVISSLGLSVLSWIVSAIENQYFIFFYELLFFYLILGGTGVILFLIYLLTSFEKKKISLLLPIAFILFCINSILSFLGLYNSVFYYSIYDDYSNTFSVLQNVLAVLNFVLIVCWILNAISAFKGFNNKFGKIDYKIIFYIACTISILIPLLNTIFYPYAGLFSDFWLAHGGLKYAICTTIIIFIGLLNAIILNLAIFSFAENTDFTLFERQGHFASEKELQVLKEKYEQGIITDEEYQEKRKAIINNF